MEITKSFSAEVSNETKLIMSFALQHNSATDITPRKLNTNISISFHFVSRETFNGWFKRLKVKHLQLLFECLAGGFFVCCFTDLYVPWHTKALPKCRTIATNSIVGAATDLPAVPCTTACLLAAHYLYLNTCYRASID